MIYRYIPTTKTIPFLKSVANPMVAKPLEFYALHVKAICLSWCAPHGYPPIKTIHTVLSTFANLQNIALWESWGEGDSTIFKSDNEKATIGHNLQPRRLSCNVERFFAIRDIPDRQPDFGAPFFSRLTHLEIMDVAERWLTWVGLETLPSLTHLTFETDFEYLFKVERLDVKQFIGKLLTGCLTLEIILFINHRRKAYTRKEEEDIMSPVNDSRCVVLPPPNFWDNWDAPFVGKNDMWRDAEEKARVQRLAPRQRVERTRSLGA